MSKKLTYEELENRVVELERQIDRYQSEKRKGPSGNRCDLMDVFEQIPLCKTFETAARIIFEQCKRLIGARSGYVALLSEDGSENEVLFLDAGGMPCEVDPELPMPVRGLREVAYRTGEAVCDNNFAESKWMKYMPPGHVELENVLFAPINVDGRTAGIIGIANKPGGFQERDIQVVSDLGKLAAVALIFAKSQEALRKSEEKYRSILITAIDGFMMTDIRAGIVEVNEAYCRMTGYSEAELLKMHICDLDAVEDPRQIEEHIRRIVHQGSERFETKHLRRDGSVFDVEVSIQFRPDEGGGVVSFVRDITGRKEAEREQKKLKGQLSNAMEIAHLGRWEYDVASDLFTFNDQFYKIFRTTAEQAGGYLMSSSEYVRRFVHPEDREMIGEGIGKALETADPEFSRQLDHRILYADGEVGYITVRYFAVKDDQGRTVGIYGVNQDITERKRAHEALRESENKMKSIFRAAPVGIGVVLDRVLQDVNQVFCDITGYSRDELVGQSARIVYPTDEEYEQVGAEKYGQIKEKGTGTVDTRFRRKDGRIVDVLLSSTPLNPADLSEGVTFTALDITERKQAERELINSEARFRDLAEMLPEAVFEADLELNLRFVNQQAYAMFGYSKEDFINGLNGYDMLVPEDRAQARNNAEKRTRGQQAGAKEYRGLKKDGTVFPVLFHTNPIVENGIAKGLRGIIVDLSERKKMERSIIESQKMESIGNLAGGIAHDFNNILFPVVGMAEMLLEDLPPGSLEYENAREILKAGKRGSDLVRQILAFSRQSEHKLTPTRPQKVIEEVVKLMRATIPSNIDIRSDLQKDCGLVMADPTQLHQVAMNLLTNAYHAVDDNDGDISISLKETRIGQAEASGRSPSPGRYALLTVADTGTGIERDILEKIFEPYFTTKEKGKGTGLGLAAVYGIVKAHGGDIQVSSEIGEGTTFRVCLPLMSEDAGPESCKVAETVQTGTERILLVDDEGAVVQIEEQMLKRLGYQVTSRQSSLDALKTFQEDIDSFDLVVTDMTMPKMTGDKLARKLIEIRPDIPIIICTGFSERIDDEKAEAMGVKGFLMKPITKAELAEMVRTVLDKAKARLR